MSETMKNIEETVVGAYKRIEDQFTDTFLKEDGSLKTGKLEETVVGAYQKIEDGVVGAYQAIEDTVVGAYKKIENKFVDKFLSQEEDDNKN